MVKPLHYNHHSQTEHDSDSIGSMDNSCMMMEHDHQRPRSSEPLLTPPWLKYSYSRTPPSSPYPQRSRPLSPPRAGNGNGNEHCSLHNQCDCEFCGPSPTSAIHLKNYVITLPSLLE